MNRFEDRRMGEEGEREVWIVEFESNRTREDFSRRSSKSLPARSARADLKDGD